LRHFDGIGDATVLYRSCIQIQDGVACTGVAITGLSHTAGIDDQAFFPKAQRLTHCNSQDIERVSFIAGLQTKNGGQMRVTNETELRVKETESLQRDTWVDNVFPNGVAGTAMGQGELTLHQNLW
jgi:hypothetical protein